MNSCKYCTFEVSQQAGSSEYGFGENIDRTQSSITYIRRRRWGDTYSYDLVFQDCEETSVPIYCCPMCGKPLPHFIDEPVDVETPLSREEAIQYCLNQGTGIEYDADGERVVSEEAIEWLLNHPRPEQAREAVRRNFDLIDFDEWMALEDLLMHALEDCKTNQDLPYATATRINGLLWENLDISPLELLPVFNTHKKAEPTNEFSKEG